MKSLRLIAVLLFAGVALVLRQRHFERYMERRARLLETAVIENLGSFSGEVNAAFGEVAGQINKNFQRLSSSSWHRAG